MSTLLHSGVKGLHEEQYLVDHSTLNERIQNQETGNTRLEMAITSRQFLKEGGKCFERRAVSWRLMAKMRVPLS